jgi:hypothetical protein
MLLADDWKLTLKDSMCSVVVIQFLLSATLLIHLLSAD